MVRCSCYWLMKFILVLFNIFFLVIGLTGFIFATWMLVGPSISLTPTQESLDYIISTLIILVSSILLIIVAGLGIYGSVTKSTCALTLFFSLLLIVLFAECAAVLWGYINRDGLQIQIHNALKRSVNEEYHQDENKKILFDTIQYNLQCCGADKPLDWIGNKEVVLAITSEPTVFSIPVSCCKSTSTRTQCISSTQNLKLTSTIDYNVVFEDGCHKKIISLLEKYAYVLLIIGVVIGSIKLICLLLSLILIFTIHRSKRYKN